MIELMSVLTFPLIVLAHYMTARPQHLPRGWGAGWLILTAAILTVMLAKDLVIEWNAWPLWRQILVTLAVGNLSSSTALLLRGLIRRNPSA